MKVGLSSFSLNQMILGSAGATILDAIRWIKQSGAEFVELVPGSFDLLRQDGLVEKIKRLTDELQLQIVGYTVMAELLLDTDDAHDREIQRILKHMDLANYLGVAQVRHDITSVDRDASMCTDEWFDRDKPRIIAACQRIADYAAPRGMTSLIENQGLHVNGASRVRQIITQVDRPNFRLTLDVGNLMLVDEDPLSSVQALLPFAEIVHFKDFYLRTDRAVIGDGPWRVTAKGNYIKGAIVGHGDIDEVAIMRHLKHSGYAGPVTVEFEGMEDCQIGAKMSLDIVRRMAREL